METKKTIVTISRNRSLQETRSMMLIRAGHNVIPMRTDSEVLRLLASPESSINLVLMCHSVPETSRVLLCEAIKKQDRKIPILMLYNGFDHTVAKVDLQLENLHEPQVLLDTVELLLS